MRVKCCCKTREARRATRILDGDDTTPHLDNSLDVRENNFGSWGAARKKVGSRATYFLGLRMARPLEYDEIQFPRLSRK